MPARTDSPPSSASTAPAATKAVPVPIADTASPTSIFASRTSLRTSVALPSARSRRSAPILRRPSRASTDMVFLLPNRFADQVAKPDGDEQGSTRMLFHLALDAGFDAVEVRFAEPTGC